MDLESDEYDDSSHGREEDNPFVAYGAPGDSVFNEENSSEMENRTKPATTLLSLQHAFGQDDEDTETLAAYNPGASARGKGLQHFASSVVAAESNELSDDDNLQEQEQESLYG